MDFKSDWVARNVLRVLDEVEDSLIRDQIRIFRSIPEAQGLAGRLLEPLAHRDGFWPLIDMNSNGADPGIPLFQMTTIYYKSSAKLQSIAGLSTRLDNSSYYVLVDPNFPLFDAFTIKLDCANKSTSLWVLQMTTSRMHGDSTKGYQKIRDIIMILKGKLQEDPPMKKTKTAAERAIPEPLIQVRYLFVVPKDNSQLQNLQWQFPKGWSQNWKKNDHRGKVYCLPVEVPLAI